MADDDVQRSHDGGELKSLLDGMPITMLTSTDGGIELP